MEVHAHAVAQAREHAEDDTGDLAPALDHVGGVDEEDVAGLERGEAVERELHGVDGLIAGPGGQGELRLWIDGDQVGVGRGRARDVGRPARAQLEDAQGRLVAQEREEQLGVAGAVERVVEAERRGDGEGGDVRAEGVGDERRLRIEAEAQAGQVETPLPGRVAGGGHSGERAVGPARHDVEPEPSGRAGGGAGGEALQAGAAGVGHARQFRDRLTAARRPRPRPSRRSAPAGSGGSAPAPGTPRRRAAAPPSPRARRRSRGGRPRAPGRRSRCRGAG